MVKQRIAPYRIGQIIGTILLNGYILAYIQGKYFILVFSKVFRNRF